jgi:uncharacterized protein YbaA (DUF1428 family)
MKYVDGYVLVIPKNKMKAYRKMAADGGKIWKKHGALEYFECIGDDMNPSMGGMKLLTFPKMAKAKSNEAVVFSFIIYKSKQHRNSVNAKVMKEMMNDPKNKDESMPFDMKRMAYGGFSSFVNL